MPQLPKDKLPNYGDNRKSLEFTIAQLNKAEQEHIKATFYDSLKLWADLLDRVKTMPENSFDSLSNTRHAQYRDSVNDYTSILNDISTLDFKNNAQVLDHIKNRIQSFKDSARAEDLANMLSVANALDSEVSNVAELKQLLSRAKKERTMFENSFAKNIERQRRTSTRTLAKHFQSRIDELEKTDSTNPIKLLESRNKWLGVLSITTIVILILNLLGNIDYTIGSLAAKATILFIISAQIYFKQRNFNIYSDLIAKYKHMSIIASTITDFLHEDTDVELKNKMIEVGVTTLFSAVDTGHLKNSDFHDNDKITNIIERLPSRPLK